MSIRTLTAMAVLFAGSALIAEKVTVARLETVVAQARAKGDNQAAKKINALALSERIDLELFKKLKAQLPGPRSRVALAVLADIASFLDPPAADIPATPPPSLDEQREIILRATQFATGIAHQSPDFSALREASQYQ